MTAWAERGSQQNSGSPRRFLPTPGGPWTVRAPGPDGPGQSFELASQVGDKLTMSKTLPHLGIEAHAVGRLDATRGATGGVDPTAPGDWAVVEGRSRSAITPRSLRRRRECTDRRIGARGLLGASVTYGAHISHSSVQLPTPARKECDLTGGPAVTGKVKATVFADRRGMRPDLRRRIRSMDFAAYSPNSARRVRCSSPLGLTGQARDGHVGARLAIQRGKTAPPRHRHIGRRQSRMGRRPGGKLARPGSMVQWGG